MTNSPAPIVDPADRNIGSREAFTAPLTPAEIAELDRALAEVASGDDPGVSWGDAKARLTGVLAKRDGTAC